MSCWFSSLLAFWFVLQCGSGEYRVREEATESLLRLSESADVYPILLLGANSKDLETARRCRMAARRFADTIRPTAADHYPALLFLEVRLQPAWAKTKVRLLNAHHAERERGLSDVERDWLLLQRSRAATRDCLPLLLKAGYSRKQIVAMLDKALEEEAKVLDAEEKKARRGRDVRGR